MLEEHIIRNIDENDKNFLIELLNIEIAEISKIVSNFLQYEEVKRYLSISATISIIDKEKFNQPERRKELKQKQQEILKKYQEVERFVEARKTLADYKKYKDKLKKYVVSSEGKIYNNVEDNSKKTYSLKEIIKYLFIIKDSSVLTEEEIRAYRNIVLDNLQTFQSFEDDKVKEIFLGTKIYENPTSYSVEEFTTMESLQTDNFYYDEAKNTINLKTNQVIDNDKLTEREKHAFYNQKAYELFQEENKEKVKSYKRGKRI